MSYTVRASVHGANELTRLAAALHRRDVRPSYTAYRETADDTGQATFVVADELAADRARRALQRVVSVTLVVVEPPGRPLRERERPGSHRFRDAFARVYR